MRTPTGFKDKGQFRANGIDLGKCRAWSLAETLRYPEDGELLVLVVKNAEGDISKPIIFEREDLADPRRGKIEEVFDAAKRKDGAVFWVCRADCLDAAFNWPTDEAT